MKSAQNIYLLGGIALSSELLLPELTLWDAGSAPAGFVNIRLSPVPLTLPGAIEVDPDCFATSSEYLLRVQGVARYLVSYGNEILVERDENALDLDVRAYLLGTVFAVLCHQRGLLPLHASAVRYPGGVVAFLARSGEGKSSFAAHLAERGFPVVADDICLVDTAGPGPSMVIPAAPWLKLWRASLEQLGRAADGLEQVFSEDDKYRLPVQAGAAQNSLERLPLGKLVFLERSEPGASVRVDLLETPRLRALNLLMNLTHQAYLVEAIGKREENFLRCSKALSQAKAYRMVRPWGFEHMEPALDRVESLLCQECEP